MADSVQQKETAALDRLITSTTTPAPNSDLQVHREEVRGLGLDPNSGPVSLPEQKVAPVAPIPTLDHNAYEDEQAEVSWLDSLKAGFQVNNTASTAHELLTAPKFQPDADWNEEALAKELAEPGTSDRLARLGGDQEEIADRLGDSANIDEFYHLLNEFEKKRDLEETAAQHITASMLSALVDPVDLAIMAGAALLPGGQAAALRAGTATITRGRRALRAAALAATANAGIEAIQATNSPYRDEHDVAIAAVFGAILGGGFSTLGTATDVAIAQAGRRAAARKAEADSAGAAGRVLEGDEVTGNLAETSRQVADRVASGQPHDPVLGWRFAENLQLNIRSRVAFSDNPRVTRLGNAMLEGGHARDRNAVRNFTAEGRANHIERTMQAKFYAETLPHFRAYAQARGQGWAAKTLDSKAQQTFYDEVSTALRGDLDHASDEAIAAAKTARKIYDDYWEMARDAGVKGFEGDPVKNYVPRMFDTDKVLRAVDEYGIDNMQAMIRESIVSAVDDIPEELAEKIARGYVRTIVRNAADMDQAMIHGLPFDDLDRLREVLAPAGNDDGLIDAIVDLTNSWREARNADGGKVRFAKQRTDLDDTYSTVTRRVDGTEGSLGIRDFLINDQRILMARYTKTMSGHIGMAREANIKSKAEFEAVIKTIQDEALSTGRTEAARVEIDALRKSYDLITGQPIDREATGVAIKANKLARTVGDVNYVQYGGSFGLSSAVEIGNVIGAHLMGIMSRTMPELRGIYTRAADGQLSNKLARELEQLGAPGTTWVRGQPISNFDELGESFGSQDRLSRGLRAVDRPLQGAKRATSLLGMLAPVTDVTQKISAQYYAGALGTLARTGRAPSASMARRLASDGVGGPMLTRILAQFKAHADYKGARLEATNWSKWTDKEALDTYTMSMHRRFRREIQENDIGNESAFAQTSLGRLVFKFRRFVMNAINKQMVAGLHYRDIETFVSVTASMFFGSLIYTGQTAIRYHNDPDELKERLTPARIAAAGFSRSGFGAPAAMITDTVLGFTPVDPIFSTTRGSGLASNFVSGNPAVRLFDDAAKTVRMATSLPTEDYRFSQADARTLSNLMPLHTILGFRAAVNAATEDLPKSSESN